MDNNLQASEKKLRHNLHLAIVNRIVDLGICNSTEIIESFKRWYLFEYFTKETSRAMDAGELHDAINRLHYLDRNGAVTGIMLKCSDYNTDKDLLRCTRGQINKIYAVAIGSLKKERKWMFNYIRSTLHRNSVKFNITVNEADKVIKRLEQFEAKEIRGNKKRENKKAWRNR